MDGADGQRLAEALDGLTHALWNHEPPEASLAWLTRAAVTAVPGAVAAGITLRDQKGALESFAVTADFVMEVDAVQYRSGEGPCVASLRHGPVHLVNDMAADPRWPTFAPAAVALGVGGMLSAHMFAWDGMAGSLNFYADRSDAFATGAEAVGLMYASQLAMTYALSRQSTRLRDALASRTEIGAALGILMERHHLTKDQAFVLLRKRSQHHNTKLREVARQVVRVQQSGRVPDFGVNI
ncbi:GAF and ANTAR domain-containing protein [Actinopolymorpha singaporensis]|uniref:ANTAR domain-containing protein n=1 Tax=Actinopolymorpha singaporensis TaxID=117157 RepID=A0A1H1YD81_9ACTN|nr:GAF and ANTAR domain-containing protein [Actinopolymorpha singaporensis]SDT19397.1 ANTAR domain-containing protein [Actinopolymorpha singaporensis]